MTKTPNKI